MIARPPPWWRGATIYQIYPRSFADADGDGIGDLPGIIAHLDHVASLGVDAIWLSPFFTSPMADFGYDVSDYRDVDPIFGTLADFDALVARAHALDIKVVIDQVYAHTSDSHAWFTQSRADRTNPRADWYVWADARDDGSPPNNWQSVFGGPTWTWDARRQQYYMHNFLSAQPQLDGHNPHVQAALIAVARFWLDRGVDGFRLDAINYMAVDRALSDNPPAPPSARPRTRPFDYQVRVHNQNQPEVLGFCEALRELLDRYDDRFTVAEIGGEDTLAMMRSYTAPGRLDTAYSFAFLNASALTPQLVADTLGEWSHEDAGAGNWPSWAFENHDVPRALSRWAPADAHAAYARMKLLLLACLRGNIFLYYGEELGLAQAEIGFADLRDPEAIANWPLTLGRDGARTPMPWRGDASGLGFTTGTPWLPPGEGHAARAVDRQAADPLSPLAFARAVLALRRASAVLRLGALRVITVGTGLLVFERSHAGERWLCAFNLAAEPVDWTPPPGSWRPVIATGAFAPGVLPGFSGQIVRPA